MKNSNDTIWDRTSDLPICSTAPNHCDCVHLVLPHSLSKLNLIAMSMTALHCIDNHFLYVEDISFP